MLEHLLSQICFQITSLNSSKFKRTNQPPKAYPNTLKGLGKTGYL